ncbi:hypothetical protein BASA50_011237 [Batrachochytrium salamandrivorans]|uniref:Uridylate kinase n=1 Tax=Batrachochytrium salamandrivorans TaxID=1357716 RepID=A0ABQ8EW48_9FUNG|nr:hypothetical protein BASA50_011237 [Batrachochytrium salamandrivorans]
MSCHRYLDDEVTSDLREYLNRQGIREVLESIVTGIAYNKPDDPLTYMEECIVKIRKDSLLSTYPTVRWNSFLPPICTTSRNSNRGGIVARKRLTETIELPPTVSLSPLLHPSSATHSSYKAPSVWPTQSRVIPPILPTDDHVAQDAESCPASIESVSRVRGQAWRNIVFVLGGPGSGKGTQCVRIAKEFHYIHLSAGDLLRLEVATGSELGKQLASIMKEGKIVPMDITLRLLREAMEAAPEAQGFLIDGFPRQLDQAIEFEAKVAKCKFVLYFECSEEVLLKRLLERGKTSGRADDNMETIKKRFQTFTEANHPVITFFSRMGKCFKISSESSPDEVFEQVQRTFVDPPLYHPNIIFVLGGPGSGKGTQCERLAVEFQLTHISAGDLLRDEVQRQSDVGNMVAGMMKEGKIVPMDIILTLLREEIKKSITSVGFLIDGFPRAMDQALEFEKRIGPCRLVLAFTCSLEVLEQRLLERGKTSGRADDNIATIQKRFFTFKEQSIPVIEYYKGKGNCVEISSERSIDEVYDDSRRVLIPPKPLFHPNIVFVLGKGTQCERLAKRFNLVHISTGDLLRREVLNKTSIGQQVEKYMQSGAMAPGNLILELLVHEILNKFDTPGFLIDGFPREMSQALEFERIVGRPRFVLFFECPLDILEVRLVERGRTSGRADDNLATIRERFSTYQKESIPVIEYYTMKSMAVKISSVDSPDKVYEVAQGNFEYLNQPLPFDGKTIIFVLGGPGSGKGTQCDILVKQFGFAHLSTGDLLRDEVNRGTDLGSRLDSDMKQGKMVPLEITIKLLLQGMSTNSNSQGYLIDGFPRTIEQAHLFESTIGKCMFVLYFEASNDVLISRLMKRGETSGRTDDNLESIRKRLVTFENSSMPVIEYYNRTGRTKKVNSEVPVDEVTARTLQHFETISPKALASA